MLKLSLWWKGFVILRLNKRYLFALCLASNILNHFLSACIEMYRLPEN